MNSLQTTLKHSNSIFIYPLSSSLKKTKYTFTLLKFEGSQETTHLARWSKKQSISNFIARERRLSCKTIMIQNSRANCKIWKLSHKLQTNCLLMKEEEEVLIWASLSHMQKFFKAICECKRKYVTHIHYKWFWPSSHSVLRGSPDYIIVHGITSTTVGSIMISIHTHPTSTKNITCSWKLLYPTHLWFCDFVWSPFTCKRLITRKVLKAF